jgi:two-component system OmpR family response regulator
VIRPPRILLVEDDAGIARLLGQTLAENGFAPRFAAAAAEMDLQLREGDIDLVVLDLMLPGEDGISICRRLRRASNLPILMLTASDEDADRIQALELGADDYVTKPFNARELVARIRTILRRSQAAARDGMMRPRSFRFAGWRLSTVERELFNPDGARITLTSAEFDVLVAFCLNPGCILSREQLLELTHGGAAGPVERTIDVHVSRIRQKIEPDPREPSLIKTVRLGGYLFTPPVAAT